MLFNIFISVLLVVIAISATLTYLNSSSYEAASNAGMAVFLAALVGGFILLFVMLGASSAAKEDPKNHVVKSEKTYTIVENSVPTVDGAKGELKFSYTENGQVFPFSSDVDAFTIGFEKPKAFKITEYDVVDKGVADWPLNEGTKVEVIK